MWIVDLLIALYSFSSSRGRKQSCPSCASLTGYGASTCRSCGYSFVQAHRQRVDASLHTPLSNWAWIVALASLGTLVIAVSSVVLLNNPDMWGSPLYGTIKLVTFISTVSCVGISYLGVKSVLPKEKNYAAAQNLVLFCGLALVGSLFVLLVLWGSFAQ